MVGPLEMSLKKLSEDDAMSALSSDESIMSLAERSMPWFSSDEWTTSYSDASTVSISSGNTTAVWIEELRSDKRALQREIEELKATVEKRDDTIALLQEEKRRTAVKHSAELKYLEIIYAYQLQLQMHLKERAEAGLDSSLNQHISSLKQQIELLKGRAFEIDE